MGEGDKRNRLPKPQGIKSVAELYKIYLNNIFLLSPSWEIEMFTVGP